jgi:hypothetical protein
VYYAPFALGTPQAIDRPYDGPRKPKDRRPRHLMEFKARMSEKVMRSQRKGGPT